MVKTANRSIRSGAAFRVALYPERDCVRVAPVGELDVDTADELEATLQELREAGFGRIVIDLRELEFLGSAGLRLLVVENHLARGDEHELAVIAGPPAVQRVIELCGLVEQLHFVEATPSARSIRARRARA